MKLIIKELESVVYEKLKRIEIVFVFKKLVVYVEIVFIKKFHVLYLIML